MRNWCSYITELSTRHKSKVTSLNIAAPNVQKVNIMKCVMSKNMCHETCDCIANNCIGYIRLPQSQKQCIYLSKVYCNFLWEKKFLAVRRVGLMTHREYRVDRPFPVTWLGNVWEPTPPPRSMGLSRLFNPHFPGLTSDTVARICDQQFWFSPIYIYCTSSSMSSPTASSRLEHRVSVFPFFS
jgi:hypothetical protein